LSFLLPLCCFVVLFVYFLFLFFFCFFGYFYFIFLFLIFLFGYFLKVFDVRDLLLESISKFEIKNLISD
jgi:hypothetical protein